MFNWKVQKKPVTSSDMKIEEITNILFPQMELHEEIDKDGTTIKFHVDYSADTNLDAALMDLQDGNNDAVTHKTIGEVIARLNTVRKILEAYAILDENAKYIIVDNPKKESDILASDD